MYVANSPLPKGAWGEFPAK